MTLVNSLFCLDFFIFPYKLCRSPVSLLRIILLFNPRSIWHFIRLGPHSDIFITCVVSHWLHSAHILAPVTLFFAQHYLFILLPSSSVCLLCDINYLCKIITGTHLRCKRNLNLLSGMLSKFLVWAVSTSPAAKPCGPCMNICVRKRDVKEDISSSLYTKDAMSNQM